MLKRTESNEQQIKYQLIATRLYIFILLTSLIILSLYTLLIEDIHKKMILQRSEF